MQTKMNLKQAVEINLNYIKCVARFVYYAALFMVTLTVIEIVFILSAAAGMRWLNWVWTLLILLGITLAIIKRRNLKKEIETLKKDNKILELYLPGKREVEEL